MKLNYFIIFLGLTFLSACQEVPSGEQRFPLNVSYADAREYILKDGWTPIENNKPEEEIGFRAIGFRDLGYTEVDDCSGTGMGYCAFHFKNENGYFLIVTTQESFVSKEQFDDVSRIIVVNYNFTNNLN